MLTFQQFLIEREGTHKYSCVLAILPDAKKFVTWVNKFIDKDDIYTAEDDEYGIETEPHVTVFFGLHTDDADEVKEVIDGQEPIKLSLGKTSIFESEKYDVVKFTVESKDLVKLNKKLGDELENTTNHPVYYPHCTISYVKKGCGKKYVGNDDFEGKSFLIKELVFSSKDKVRTRISL
jgi:hypothetical protein